VIQIYRAVITLPLGYKKNTLSTVWKNYRTFSDSHSKQIRGVANKSLPRLGRKQATATKLGIYSTYSPRSSIHFLARCSDFCKSLKKKIQEVIRPTRSSRHQWFPSRTKNGDLSVVFLVQGTGGSPTGPDPENMVGDQDTGSLGRPVSSGLQVPVEPRHCRARTRPAWWPSRGFFLQNVLQLHQQRWVILRVDSLALSKIISEEDAVLIPKKIETRNFPADFCTRNFWTRGEPLCRHSIVCCFVSGS